MSAAKHTPSADNEVARALLLWARENRFVVHDLTVGTIRLCLHDAGAPALSVDAGDLEDAARNLYAEYGGAALEAAKRSADEATYEDDEE